MLLRLQTLVLNLLILFLPTQLGKHFWPNFSYISGIRIDYLSPTIYLTDVFVGLLFIMWFLSKLQKFQASAIILAVSNYWRWFVLIFVFLTGIILSKNPLAGWYGFFKFLEFTFLGFYTTTQIRDIRKLEKIVLLFFLGILFESFLAIIQYFHQGSLEGVFYFFGERMFNPQTPGIANASLNGQLILRPYATFSHPNVLAGYLVIAMTMVIFNFKKAVYLLCLIMGTVALLLTMSRVAILLWFIILGFAVFSWWKRRFKRFFLLYFFFFIFFIAGVFSLSPLSPRFTSISLLDESLLLRVESMKEAFIMIKNHPIFGVGINNFLVNLVGFQKPAGNIFYLQPAHNIYLLITSETGIIGLGFFLWFIVKTFKNIKDQSGHLINVQSLVLFLVLFLGLFDHYWLTLQQGQLLFSFVLGFCWVSFKSK